MSDHRHGHRHKRRRREDKKEEEEEEETPSMLERRPKESAGSCGVQLQQSESSLCSMTTEAGEVITGKRAMLDHAVQFLQDSMAQKSLNSMRHKAGRYQSTYLHKSKLLAGCPQNLGRAKSWIDRFVGSDDLESSEAAVTPSSTSTSTTVDGMGMYNMMKKEGTSGMAPRRPYMNVTAVMPHCSTMEQFLRQAAQKEEEEEAPSKLSAAAAGAGDLSSHPESISNSFKTVTSYMSSVLNAIPYWEKQNGLEEAGPSRRPDPPVITAAHVQRVLLEAWGPFHPCSMSNMCTARNLLHTQKPKITLMGFLYPEEYEAALRDGHCALHNMCYVCTLLWVLLQWCINEGNNHQNKYIELPFSFRMNEPGEYARGMIQSLNGHVNGLTAPFRHMTCSDFVEHSEMVMEAVPTAEGGTQRIERRVYGFRERSELFLVNSSSDSTWFCDCNYSVRPSVYSVYSVTPLTTESLLRADIHTSKIGEQYVALLYEDQPERAAQARLEPLFQLWPACVASFGQHLAWMPGLGEPPPDAATWQHLNLFSWICLHGEEPSQAPPPASHLHYYVMHYRVNAACALLAMLHADVRARAEKHGYNAQRGARKRGRAVEDEFSRFKKPRQRQLEHRLLLFLESHSALLSWYRERSLQGLGLQDDALLAEAAYPRRLQPQAELYLYPEDLTQVEYSCSIRRSRSPQSMLRALMAWHEVQADSVSEAHARLLLLSFRGSLEALRALPGSQKLELLQACSSHSEWRPHPLLEALLQLPASAWEGPDASHSIVLTLLLRVNYGLRLLRDTDELLRDAEQRRGGGGSAPEAAEYERLMELSFQLRCYVNSHLELSFHVVEEAGAELARCSDVLLCAEPVSGPSPYDLAYPASRRAFQEGDLPDLSKQMPAIKFVVDNSIPEKTLRELGSPAIYAMLGKLMPGVCFKRVLSHKHMESCAADAAYKEWASICLRISLMGMYRHARAWPSYEDSMRLQAAFNDDSGLDFAMTFMAQRCLITSNALREFAVFTMALNPGYLELVRLLFEGWDTFALNVRKSMDTARHLSRQHSNYSHVEYTIGSLFEVDPHKPVYRSTSTDFPHFMVKEFESLNSGRDEGAERARGRRIRTSQRMAYSMEEEYRAAIDAHVDALEPWSEIKLEVLLQLGLSQDGYDRLLAMWRMFMMREVKDNSRDQMHALGLHDYDILYYFFHRLDWHYRLTAVPLTAEMTARQGRALRQRFHCPNSEPLTPVMSAMAMTRCCREIKTFCCPRRAKNDPPNACDAPNFFGHVRIYWDRASGSYRCDKKSNGGKRGGLGLGRAGASTPGIRQKTVDKYRMACRSQPVQMLNAFGKVFEYVKMSEMGDAVARTFCPACGQLFEFALHKIGMNGLSCGLCDAKQRERFALPRCICCTNIPRRVPDGKYWLAVSDGPQGSGKLERVYSCATCSRRLSCFGSDNVTFVSSLLHHGRKPQRHVYKPINWVGGCSTRMGALMNRAQISRSREMYSNQRRRG